MRKSGQNTSTLSVEIKYSDFQSVSRQTSLNTPTSTTQIIYETSCKLFDELWNGSPIRLLGIRSAKLTSHDEPVQLSLFEHVKAPLLVESPVNIECRVTQTLQLGTHDMFLAEVLAVHADEQYMDDKGRFHLDWADPNLKSLALSTY